MLLEIYCCFKKVIRTYTVGFIEAFIEIYNVIASLILIFFIGQILFIMSKVDKDVLKARLFLDEAVTQKTWMYISIAGASFALNALIKFTMRLSDTGEIPQMNFLVESSQFIFLLSFILAVYNWYVFVSSFVRHRDDTNQKNRVIQMIQ
ncbi:hypothetical protein [Candidatus Methanoperedens nitratireducens]|uniref:Uncharacterized protein n=1 Tax=Candidatus Methanoperedens nitratireducens TaxID=1392998 RepID=A0A284VQ65_9EURY|nr:hypothetical protein [Candidatus Methanoperedens nitroreducens]SNQ61343.1 hypothetical protein MNV_330011 [Candidatus Methanoperedens nitroreducens]